MPRVSILTNPDKLVEQKANFFADWFHYTVSNIGRSCLFELENPLSLINKIIYQIENNPEKSYSYVIDYLLHPMLANGKYLDCFDGYSAVKNNITWFRTLSKSDQKMVLSEQNSGFLSDLKHLEQELGAEMFKSSLTVIISYLRCPHPLSEHEEDIKFHTHILVTEYLFRGRDKRDLNEVFRKILSHDIHEFPFPADIISREDRETHLKTRGLEGQFKGLYNLLEQPGQEWTFYFRVFGAQLEDSIMFRYDEVRFYSRNHPAFERAKEENDHYFSKDHNFFICEVSVYFYSQKVAVAEAVKKIRKELVYVSLIMERDLMLDNNQNYFIRTNGKFFPAWGSEQFTKTFDKEILAQLKDNPFEFLKHNQSAAKKHFVDFEYLFIGAAGRNHIPDYWHYLETLLQDNKKENELREKLATILLLDEQAALKRGAINDLFGTMDLFNLPDRFNLTWEDTISIQKELYKRQISQKIREINYPMITYMVKDSERQLTKDEFNRVKAYNLGILKEAYAQRNFYIHNAVSNQKLNIKLIHSLPLLVQRFRWIVFDELKRNMTSTFSELIEQLYDNAKLLL